MTFSLSARSRERMRGVHPDLVKVVERAIQITPIDFVITEGVRSLERQRQLVKSGASKTMNSRHIKADNGYGHAIDFGALVGGKLSWDWPLYETISKAFKQAARELGVAIEWGGDWKSFRDGPHIQLTWKAYPANGQVKAAKYTGETVSQAKTKGVSALAAGGAAGGTIAIEPLSKAVDAISSQQNELTSGDLIRIVLAAVIIGLSVYVAWRKL